MKNKQCLNGKFITIEGQDGAGKTTNLEFICDYLRQHDIDLLVTREPGGTVLGENIRELLLEKDISISAKAELLLMFSARSQHLEEVILPAINTGKWVVCDRFTDATYAYQGGGHNIPDSMIEKVENFCLEGFEPDLTFLLDIDVSTSQARTQERTVTENKNELDRFERQKTNFKQRVREAYLKRFEQDSTRIKIIDASQPLTGVQSEIAKIITAFLKSMTT